MKNTKYYPFERNHYFYGKLMSVRDFNEEQKYTNDKRRMQNVLTNGVGVVAGMNVVLIDERTISIGAGIAMDSQGREVVIEESITKKVGVIDGFSDLKNPEEVFLCVSYDEKEEELVHAISGSEGGNHNRILEGYQLYLTDNLPKEHMMWLSQLQNKTTIIYEGEGILITQQTPKYVTAKGIVEVKVTIEKRGVIKGVEVDYLLSCEYLRSESGTKEIRIYHRDEGNGNQKTELTFYGMMEDVENGKNDLLFTCADGQVMVGAEKIALSRTIEIPVTVEEKEVKDRIIKDYFATHFEDIMARNLEHPICLAKLRLIQRDDAYSILELEKLPFEQRVLSNQMLYMLLKDAWLEMKLLRPQKNVSLSKSDRKETQKDETNFMSGKENIYIDLQSKDKVYYSDEIAHGLGEGNVCVKASVGENVDGSLFYEQNTIVSGDLELLKGTIFEPNLPLVKIAVVSYPEKGTFRIVVKMLENAEETSLQMYWWAIKNDEIRTRNYAEMNEVSVEVTPNTVTVAPKEKVKLDAKIIGSDSQECRFAVVEPEGGQISTQGLYEAPTKEGVYEIIVESVQYPTKKATAYIVVKEK
ncbi:MAG: hypothetical protein R3Y53_03930 [Bacillota bacterium]